MGDSLARAEAALDAGCDMVLVCNKPESVVQVIDGLKIDDNPFISDISSSVIMLLKLLNIFFISLSLFGFKVW